MRSPAWTWQVVAVHEPRHMPSRRVPDTKRMGTSYSLILPRRIEAEAEATPEPASRIRARMLTVAGADRTSTALAGRVTAVATGGTRSGSLRTRTDRRPGGRGVDPSKFEA